MELCTPHPALDLYDPGWPVLPVASGLGPAKVVADRVGRMGQALNALVADGAIIRGGVAQNTVIGHGVVIDSAAEVDDSVLLDGCRIGRGARVRRAIIGAGIAIPEGDEIGYGAVPSGPRRRRLGARRRAAARATARGSGALGDRPEMHLGSGPDAREKRSRYARLGCRGRRSRRGRRGFARRVDVSRGPAVQWRPHVGGVPNARGAARADLACRAGAASRGTPVGVVAPSHTRAASDPRHELGSPF